MKAVIAIDSFKGSMDSIEAGVAAAEGVIRMRRRWFIRWLMAEKGLCRHWRKVLTES